MLKKILKFSCLFIPLLGNSQNETDTTNVWLKKPSMTVSGLVDVFYIYDFNKPKTDYRQPFLYNHNRHNEFNLNLGFVKLAIANPKYRANFALQAGTFVQDNYALEPIALRNVFEANVGFSISKKNRVWVDGGIFTSHIGFESLYSTENWTPTFSMVTENLPYYSSGLRLSFKPNDKWELGAWALNGWQRIKRVEGNSMLSFGTQIKYTKSANLTLNWSSFVGTNDPDSTRRIRVYNNFYGIYQLSKRFGLITGFDIGMQQKVKNSSSSFLWYCPVIIGRLTLNQNFKTSIRVEYYNDSHGVIIPTNTPNGFQTFGTSWNLDYTPIPNVVCRFETRFFNSRDDFFIKGSKVVANDFYTGLFFALKF